MTLAEYRRQVVGAIEDLDKARRIKQARNGKPILGQRAAGGSVTSLEPRPERLGIATGEAKQTADVPHLATEECVAPSRATRRPANVR